MKLAVLSNDRLNPWVNWSTLGPPVLPPLAAAAGGQLVSPPPLGWAARKAWLETARQMWRADTIFWMQGSARPEWPLVVASLLRGPTRRSAFVIDAWKPQLDKIGMAAMVQRLDPCFVAFREGCEELQRRHPRARFEWMPFGIDTKVFRPGDGERDIFAFWMGRRYEPLHQALVAYCQKHGLDYRYRQPGVFLSTEELGELAGRTQYFLVTPPDLDDPVRTGGFSPLVMRYLEGLSAGARLLGVMPRSGEYEALLPRQAMLEVAADGSDLAEKLDADRDNHAAWSAVATAQGIVRREHSWERRVEQILARLAHGTVARFGQG